MISIVLDTNVFISEIFWSGPPSLIIDAWQNQKIKLITSPDIIEEYARIAHEISKRYKNIDIYRIIELVTIFSEVYKNSTLKSQISRDPDDDKFIACAINSGCKIIISGDKDLLDIGNHGNIKIITPSDFIKNYLP